MPPISHIVVDHGPAGDAGPTTSIIWMHGLGDSGHGFAPIVPELQLPRELSTRFIFPHADERPVTINGGMVMRAWFDLVSLEGSRNADLVGIRASAVQIVELIEMERARGVPANKIVLAGFSQGGAMALQVGLRYPEPLAGLMALSAFLLEEDDLGTPALASNAKTPILQCHGRFDPMVQLARAEHACKTLEGHGYAVDWRVYEMEHSLHPQEVVDLSIWLTERLLGSSPGDSGSAD